MAAHIIHELHYASTNTYLIEGKGGKLLFDTGWAGTFPAFCRAMGELHIPVQALDAILVSHFHPDHMGIVQEIADQGAVILVADVQKGFVHAADEIFEKEKNSAFCPIRDEGLRYFSIDSGRRLLAEFGIAGQILHTPGHSADSISLCLDSGELFVGDLNPLYELELHGDDEIGESWKKLLALQPFLVYYGHAQAKRLGEEQAHNAKGEDRYALVAAIVKYIDKGWDKKKIQKKTGADPVFIEDVMRMYLTHTDVGVQGILDRIEIKNR